MDDLAAAGVLCLDDLGRASVPFSVTASCDRSVLEASFSFDLLDKQGDKFIDSVLALVYKDVDSGADALLQRFHIVQLERCLHVLLDLCLEGLLLFVKLFFELDAETLVFGGDISKGFGLQLSHLIIDLLNFAEVLTSGCFKCLL